MFREVVCPFCSLGCDDLEVAVDGHGGAAGGPHPARPRPRVSAARRRAAEPLVDGVPATVEAAVERAADLLRGSALPLFGGLGTDVAGMRGVLALAERTGGIVDHAGSRGLLANVRAMQDGGTVTATLAEVRNRADLVLVIATDVAGRVVALRRALPRPDHAACSGPCGASSSISGRARRLPGAELDRRCAADRVGEAVAALRALGGRASGRGDHRRRRAGRGPGRTGRAAAAGELSGDRLGGRATCPGAIST